jgi:hypothetical protein
MRKFKKILFITLLTVVLFETVIIVFISPLAKHLITKYDEKYTGRKITIDRVYVNPLTGYIRLANLKIYELNSDSIFFSADGLSLNVALLKLLFKTYEISSVKLDHPRGAIIQKKTGLNITDLVDKFSAKADTLNPNESDTIKPQLHLNILKIRINDGEFHYSDLQTPVNYFIKKVNLESTGKRWDTDTINAQFSLVPGIGTGDLQGEITINMKNDDYNLAIVAHNFNLSIIEQYIKELTNYGTFSANLDADIKSKGNFADIEAVSTSGRLAISDFHFGKNRDDDYASFDKLILLIREISPRKRIFSYDSIMLNNLYIKYERYDYLDNIQTLFGKDGSNISEIKSDPTRFNLVLEIADYIKVISKNFLSSDYKIDHLRMTDALIKFNDYSTNEKFALELYPLNIVADSIDKNRRRVNVNLESDIKPYGSLAADLSINPKDSSDFDLKYHFLKLPVAMFNPYVISVTSFPLDRGTLEFKGTWNVRNGIIKSNNHLIIIDPRLSKRIRRKDTKWIPAPLIMAFIRERGNVIDYQIPITGNLKDPEFHWSDVIFDLLGNIFIKPPSIPYIFEVKNVEAEIEKALTLKWNTRQNLLLATQEKFIDNMSEFLSKNPNASITVHPQYYASKEKEYILLFEAKKKYFLKIKDKKTNTLSSEDSLAVDKMSVKDSMFVQYLNRHLKDSLVFTIQEKCAGIIDSSVVNAKFNQLSKDRESAFNLFFKKRDVEKQIKFSANEYVIPYNGFSFYRIEYHGEIPESLIKAYRQMNELNNEAPRKKYKQERRKSQRRL